jgi:hypothetical protein
MAISKKRAPAKSDRTIQDIYKILNELIDAVNRYESFDTTGTEGKVGDIRLTKTSEVESDVETPAFKIRARFPEGWKEIELG